MSEPPTGLTGGGGSGFDRDEKKTSRVDVFAGRTLMNYGLLVF